MGFNSGFKGLKLYLTLNATCSTKTEAKLHANFYLINKIN